MAKLTINVDNCKGCGLCVDVCPKKVLELASNKINKKGHKLQLQVQIPCILQQRLQR